MDRSMAKERSPGQQQPYKTTRSGVGRQERGSHNNEGNILTQNPLTGGRVRDGRVGGQKQQPPPSSHRTLANNKHATAAARVQEQSSTRRTLCSHNPTTITKTTTTTTLVKEQEQEEEHLMDSNGAEQTRRGKRRRSRSRTEHSRRFQLRSSTLKRILSSTFKDLSLGYYLSIVMVISFKIFIFANTLNTVMGAKTFYMHWNTSNSM